MMCMDQMSQLHLLAELSDPPLHHLQNKKRKKKRRREKNRLGQTRQELSELDPHVLQGRLANIHRILPALTSVHFHTGCYGGV